ICHMTLVPSEKGSDADFSGVAPAPGPAASPPAGGKRRIYRSTMNPNEVSETPGKDSMGMDMVPGETGGEISSPPASVEGLGPVRIPPARQQLIGMTTTLVARAPFRRSFRAVGRVAYDETRLHRIPTKVAGIVERLYANATGQTVRAGQPLLE